MSEMKKLLGRRIKQIRKSRKMTQQELAELIGIEIPSISYIETGKFAPSLETLQKLCKVLKAKPWEFYYFDLVSHDEMLKQIAKTLKGNEKITNSVYHFVNLINV